MSDHLALVNFLQRRASNYLVTAQSLEASDTSVFSREMLAILAAQAYRALADHDFQRAQQLAQMSRRPRYFVEPVEEDNVKLDTPSNDNFDLSAPPFDIGDFGEDAV